MPAKKDNVCISETGFGRAVDKTTGRYKMEILYCLAKNPVLRYNELKRMLDTIAFRTLSNLLKELESDGLVLRKEYSQIPPKVEYRLSKAGLQFVPIIEQLEKWGNKYARSKDTK